MCVYIYIYMPVAQPLGPAGLLAVPASPQVAAPLEGELRRDPAGALHGRRRREPAAGAGGR